MNGVGSRAFIVASCQRNEPYNIYALLDVIQMDSFPWFQTKSSLPLLCVCVCVRVCVRVRIRVHACVGLMPE
jgi:hypothetical protein